jgi:hypothetical protein
MSGGQKAVIVVVAVVLLGLGGCAVVVGTLVNRGASKINKAANDLSGKSDCSFFPAKTAATVMDGDPVMVPLRGLASLAGVALDQRALADAPSCMFSPSDGKVGPLGRVARVQSSDAKKIYAAELTKAKGVTTDQGNGLSVESMSYFAKTVEVGDEAFCTSIDVVPMSGVLARKGDVVVYVSLLPASQLDQTSATSEVNLPSIDDDNCQRASKIARAVLNG